MKKYDDLMTTHPLWDDNLKRWRLLWESYIGGDTYGKAGHLIRYQYESPNEYDERIKNTPLDNHCKGVIDVYNSFLFRNEPERQWGRLESDPGLQDFLKDSDMEGRTFNAFMKDVFTYSAIFGHTWVIVSKPQTNSGTRAAELEQGVRPYVSMLSPLNVLDWSYDRQPNGYYALTYLKYIEDQTATRLIVKEWAPEAITTTIIDREKKETLEEIVEDNGLGIVPAVIVYSTRSHHRGIGISAINDIADLQKGIYNEYSEVEQLIRLSNHPALVKTSDVEAVAGAGAVIQMPDTMDPGLKPYLLQPSGANLSEVYNSIKQKVEAIDRIAHLGSVRATKASTQSGVAMETEFQQLNARLSEIADNLEVGEEQIWRIWAMYQNQAWDGEIDYPSSFNVRDRSANYQQLKIAKETATDPRVYALIDHELVELMGEDPEEVLGYDEYEVVNEEVFEVHTMTNPETGETLEVTSQAQHMQLTEQGWIHE